MASLLSAARRWVDSIHVHAGARGVRDGRAVWVKRRRCCAGFVMRLANGFFRLARNPVEAIAGAEAWRRWEVESFALLHGPEFRAGDDGAVWAEVLPGVSLSSHLAAGTLMPAMMIAAATELRRAHALECAHFGGAWSHGDPHTGNFVFDATTGRARLIDFEARHLRTLGTDERHADDLLVLLQDICGRCAADAWPPLARALLENYARPDIAARVRARLVVPRALFPRLWWAVRTTWMPRAELERRLREL